MSTGRRVAFVLTAVVLSLVYGCSGGGTAPTAPDYAALSKAIDDQVAAGPAALKNLRAVVFSVHGKTVLSRYYTGDETSYEHVWSVTKSVVSALIGIAVAEGKIASLDETLSDLLPRYRSDMSPTVASITLRQLLTMTAGFPDDNGGGGYFDPGHDDIVRHTLRTDTIAEPGTEWAYSNAGAHLIATVLAEATDRTVLDYAREKLFEPLGIDTEPAYTGAEPWDMSETFLAAGFAWATDRQGTNNGCCMLKLTTADMVKIGELYLNGGMWRGRQVVPTEWVQASTSGSPVQSNYGYLWWLSDQQGHPAFAAIGSQGNAIIVVPDLQLVVVFTGRSTDVSAEALDGDYELPILTKITTAVGA